MPPTARPAGAQELRRLEGLRLRSREPRFQLQVALAALFAFFVGAFAHVVEDYLGREELTRWDVEFSRWLHVHANGTLTSFFKVVTYAGNVAFLALFTVAIAAYFVRRARINEAAFVLVSALGIELLNAVLKLGFHRQRPEFAYVHLDTYSFPSGHATGATAIYGVVIYLLVRDRLTVDPDHGGGRFRRADRPRRVQPAVPGGALPLGRAGGLQPRRGVGVRDAVRLRVARAVRCRRALAARRCATRSAPWPVNAR